MPTSVVLSPHFESFVKQQVSAGRSSNVIDMARAGLRLLKDREDPKALPTQPWLQCKRQPVFQKLSLRHGSLRLVPKVTCRWPKR